MLCARAFEFFEQRNYIEIKFMRYLDNSDCSLCVLKFFSNLPEFDRLQTVHGNRFPLCQLNY